MKSIDSRGTLDVLRHGVKFYGKRIDCAYFRPAHGLNPEIIARYGQNRLVVTRQIHFAPTEDRDEDKSIDLMLSLNGLPIATAELKNPLTGADRPPRHHPVPQTRPAAPPVPVQEAGAGPLRRRSRPRLHDDQARGRGHVLLALQPRQQRRRRQPRALERLPHGLPLGGGLATGPPFSTSSAASFIS